MVKKIDWSTKVQLSEQGRATENRELQSYRAIFIALETILFTAVSTKLWDNFWGVIVAFLGLMLTALWWHICDLRGDAVDRWEEALARLWQEADEAGLAPVKSSELYKHYKGAIKRRKIRLKRGRGTVYLGWGWGRIKSARWVFNTVIPTLVFGGWIVVIVIMLVHIFDC